MHVPHFTRLRGQQAGKRSNGSKFVAGEAFSTEKHTGSKDSIGSNQQKMGADEPSTNS
jgi:hypothetical protein